MKDIFVIGALILAFASLVTAHVAIAFGLAFRMPRWRAPAAFFVAPLAPYWAWREKMRIRAGVWTAALTLYVIATVIARA